MRFRNDGAVEEVHHVVQPSVIPAQDSLIGDLLSMDLGAPAPVAAPPPSAVDLLGGGLDGLVSFPEKNLTL